jgi:hypothetical protein
VLERNHHFLLANLLLKIKWSQFFWGAVRELVREDSETQSTSTIQLRHTARRKGAEDFPVA